jgi:hypothetical protein
MRPKKDRAETPSSKGQDKAESDSQGNCEEGCGPADEAVSKVGRDLCTTKHFTYVLAGFAVPQEACPLY